MIIPTLRALLVLLPICAWVTHWSMGNISISGPQIKVTFLPLKPSAAYRISAKGVVPPWIHTVLFMWPDLMQVLRK